MACLETTFIIDLLRGKPEIRELKDELDKTEALLSVAAPTIMEIWSGALRGKTPQREKINELISSLTVLPLDENSSKEAGEIEAELLKKGITIDIEDIMIAGIAKVNGERLITRDGDYAKIPGLKIIKY